MGLDVDIELDWCVYGNWSFHKFEAAGRFFEPSKGNSNGMAAGMTRRTCHVLPSLLTQRPYFGPVLIPCFGSEPHMLKESRNPVYHKLIKESN
jgi:hypothetical protein